MSIEMISSSDNDMLLGNEEGSEGTQNGTTQTQSQSKMTLYLIMSTIVGIVVGISVHEITDNAEVITWLSFPGFLWLRALKCLVLPLIFCNMVMGTSELAHIGRAGFIGSRTIFCYLTTTVFAVLEGMIFVLMFRGLYTTDKKDSLDDDLKVALKCQV